MDQDSHVPDILVQRRRDTQAAKKFFRKLLKELTSVQRVLITDKLKCYGAAKRELLPGVEHRQRRYLYNRIENSHQSTRQRGRRRQRFKSPRARPAFPLRLWSPGPTLPPAPASAVRPCLSSRDAEEISELAGDHESDPGCLRKTRSETLRLSLMIASVQISWQ